MNLLGAALQGLCVIWKWEVGMLEGEEVVLVRTEDFTVRDVLGSV